MNNIEEAILITMLTNITDLGDNVINEISKIVDYLTADFNFNVEVESLVNISNSIETTMLQIPIIKNSIVDLVHINEMNNIKGIDKNTWWELEQIKQKIVVNILDTLSQALFSLQIINRRIINFQLDEYILNKLEKFKESLSKLLKSIRFTSNRIYPLILNDLGVIAAVKSYVDHLLEENSIKIRYEINGELSRYPKKTELKLFRTFQELDNLIFQHTKSLIKEVSFFEDNKFIQFDVYVAGEGKYVQHLKQWSDWTDKLKVLEGVQTLTESVSSFIINVKFLKGVENVE